MEYFYAVVLLHLFKLILVISLLRCEQCHKTITLIQQNENKYVCSQASFKSLQDHCNTGFIMNRNWEQSLPAMEKAPNKIARQGVVH